MHALIIEDEWFTAQLIEDRLRDLGSRSTLPLFRSMRRELI